MSEIVCDCILISNTFSKQNFDFDFQSVFVRWFGIWLKITWQRIFLVTG